MAYFQGQQVNLPEAKYPEISFVNPTGIRWYLSRSRRLAYCLEVPKSPKSAVKKRLVVWNMNFMTFHIIYIYISG